MADAKEMWEAIKSRFGGSSKGYDRFQTLLSQLEIHGAGVSHKDANQKFLRSLPSYWSQVALNMITKPGLETLSFDDLYNNLRVFERDVKGTTASSSNIQNVAFVSADNTSSTNDVSTAYSVSSPSVLKPQKKGSSSYTDEIIDDDMEEMDLKWHVAMISMRINKFHNRTCRKLQFDTKDLVGFNKTKVECFNCHKIRHFPRDCRAKGNQDSRRRDAGNSGSDNENVFINKASDLEDTPVNDRYADGMHATSADESDSKPSEYASCESDSSVETSTSMPEPVENTSKVVCESKVWTDALIIEEYELDSDNDSMSNVQKDKGKPSFANFVKHVKTSRENIKETGTTNHSPKIEKQDRNGHTRKGLGYAFTRKACFVCGSFSHLIRDCNFHEKRMAKQAELTKSKNKDDPHKALKDKEIIDSGCSRHMRGNEAHLGDYEEFKGGSVAFGGSNGKMTGKGKIKAGKLDFEDVYYVEE
nr:hypothetical protein [Tanacetum cinerariifolium]